MNLLLDQIVEKDNIFLRKMEEIKKLNRTVVLYGNGFGARNVASWMIDKGIEKVHIAVNRKFLNMTQSVSGIEVEAIEDLLSKMLLDGEKCYIVVAFIGFEQGQLERYKDSIYEILNYDIFCGLLIKNEIPRIEYDWVKNNIQDLQWVYERLEDQMSKKSYIAYLNQKISGDYKYNKDIYMENQYVLPEIIKLDEDEIFIDCGAYDGDSINQFVKAINQQKGSYYSRIIAFEPDEKNWSILEHNIKTHSNCEIIKKGIWSKPDTLYFNGGLESSSNLSNNGDIQVLVESIDHILAGTKATFIKMDIEGAELQALKGAEKTIIKYRPKLAICIYHKPEDLIEIPKYIKELVPDYKFYIRNHHAAAIETVLYAI